jgi:hypothetical protein
MNRLGSVFIVGGAVGEYSDHKEWAVAAFQSEAEAEAFVALLDSKVQAWQKSPESMLAWSDSRTAALKRAIPEDPEIQFDYYGPNYFVYEVPFR